MRAINVLMSTFVLSAAPAADAVPGLIAGTGDDQTLALLYALEQFQSLSPTELPTHLWFDPYRGDDATGRRTRGRPNSATRPNRARTQDLERRSTRPLRLALIAVAIHRPEKAPDRLDLAVC